MDRVPPHNIEAEQSVLAAGLIEKEALLMVVDVGLKPEMFYRDDHRRIFEAEIELLNDDEPVDVVTVSDRLRSRGALDRIGGVSALVQLANILPTAANVEYYAGIVREKWIRRRMIESGMKIMRLAWDEFGDIDEQAGQAEILLLDATQEQTRGKLQRFGEVILSRWEDLYNSRGNPNVVGIRTGLAQLDTGLGGMQRGDLLVLAGRPSQGKTALALTIARNVAGEDKRVAIFSLEMSKAALAERAVCAEARLNSHAVRARALRDLEWDRAFSTASRIAGLPIWVDDEGLATTLEMRARARRLKAEQDLDLVVIDYLGLIQDRQEPGMGRPQHVGQITQRCKAMARELDVPVLLLAQLNRAVEQRQDKLPSLADLKESGDIEQIADVVVFIHNPTKNPDSGPRELIIAKQRNGPTGKFPVYFHREYTRFEDLDTRREESA